MLKYMDFLESLGISKSSLQEGMQQKRVDIALRSRCMYFVKDLMSSSTNSSDASYMQVCVVGGSQPYLSLRTEGTTHLDLVQPSRALNMAQAFSD